jgi:error-prone DNA polymerase
VLGIRLPFSAVTGVSEDAARVIVLERQQQPFSDLEDFYARVRLPIDTLGALAQAGVLECFGSRRDVLWLLGTLENSKLPRNNTAQNLLFNLPAITQDDLAWLESLDEHEVVAWDLNTTRTSLETHPIALLRSGLEAAGIRRLDRIYDGQRCAIAGLVVARQHPETARGFVFLYLEDETGHCQGIVHPELWDMLRSDLRSRALVLRGKVQRLRGWKTMVIESVMPLGAIVARESEMAYFVR